MPHEYFMQRCLQLAAKGRGQVAPNPMVGCVIVHDGRIIGEGYHQQYGDAHAEVQALNSVKNPELLKEATVYVSLEPCSHFGKTPPCANLLIEHRVKKVVIGCLDSNKEVAGRGIELLKTAGIEVEVGVLENACRQLNARFFTYHEKQRPYIILKWAETKDGFIAGMQKQISGNIAQTRLHQWRTEEAAFMVGTKTLIEDNPQLNARLWRGNNPIRVAIDFELKSQALNEKQALHFYDGLQPSIILNGLKNETTGTVDFVKVIDRTPVSIINALFGKHIQSVVIEGGQALLQAFIDAELYDEIRIFRSKELLFNEGLIAPVFTAKEIILEDLETDLLTIYRNE
jgi:diaminohydroxyphosphoribosylaminopyrimidine deaminase/5-amino-6-(5-phosphoribosylamino)uracil reductase